MSDPSKPADQSEDGVEIVDVKPQPAQHEVEVKPAGDDEE